MGTRPAVATFLFVFCIAAFAKDKPRVTIEVVNSEASQRQYGYTMPGRKGTSETNCNTNGTTYGTINDYGVGPIQTNSTGSADTNCTTTTTPATSPQTYVRSIEQEHVSAILPDGRQLTLWCQSGFRRCDYLQPGEYEAQIDGNALFVFVHEFSGKERKIKYKVVGIQEGTVVQQPQTANPDSGEQRSHFAQLDGKSDELNRAAQAGVLKAEMYLAYAYAIGNGVPKDLAIALMWYKKALEQHPNLEVTDRNWINDQIGAIQGQLADRADTQAAPATLSAPPSPTQPLANTKSAPSAPTIDTPKGRAATDDAETQFHLGTLYETGKGVPQDYAQAVLWYRKAAAQNLAIAQYRLGVLYANGVGVPLDKAQSVSLFQKAAAQGYVYAQVMLGSDYLTGDGVRRDYAEAYFWFDIACASNAREVVAEQRATMRDTAAVYLSPTELSREQERVRQWLEDHPAKP